MKFRNIDLDKGVENMYAELFRAEIEKQMNRARSQGQRSIELISGEIHRSVGGYPGPDHRMPICCQVIYSVMKSGDQIIYAPPKGKGATLKIRYNI